MSELKQAQLMTYIEAAITFYERVAGKRPSAKQVQQLLAVAGIEETKERIKAMGDDVLHLRSAAKEAE